MMILKDFGYINKIRSLMYVCLNQIFHINTLKIIHYEFKNVERKTQMQNFNSEISPSTYKDDTGMTKCFVTS